MFTFLGQLSDKQAERNFQITQLPATRRRMRFLCIISGLAYLGAIYADSMQLFGTDLGMMASARILTVLIGLDSTELQQKNISGTYGTNPAVLYMAAIIFTEMFEIIVKSGQIQLLAPPSLPLLSFCFICTRHHKSGSHSLSGPEDQLPA